MAADDKNLFEQIDIGLLSIGGRATYVDPNPTDLKVVRGGQGTAAPSRYLASGSVDYRRNDIGDTRVHTYPVQVSALIYPLGNDQACTVLLGGGGWYYTTVRGTWRLRRHPESIRRPCRGLQFFFNRTSRSTAPTDTSGWERSNQGPQHRR